MTLRRSLATSNHWYARAARGVLARSRNIAVPAPRVIVVPALYAYLGARAAWHFFIRVCVVTPLFKGYCTRHGSGLRTDIHLPWIKGRGDLLIGDNVHIDGAISVSFAARFVDRPVFELGSHTGIGHGCRFVIGKRITIGSNCRLAHCITMRDSHGHPSDPEARRRGDPPSVEDVKPITVGDNVWIGAGAYVFPGVTIGEGAVVSAQAVVTGDVAPYTVVAGNPARRVGILDRSAAGTRREM